MLVFWRALVAVSEADRSAQSSGGGSLSAPHISHHFFNPKLTTATIAALAVFGLSQPTFATDISGSNVSLSGSYSSLTFVSYTNIYNSSSRGYVQLDYGGYDLGSDVYWILNESFVDGLFSTISTGEDSFSFVYGTNNSSTGKVADLTWTWVEAPSDDTGTYGSPSWRATMTINRVSYTLTTDEVTYAFMQEYYGGTSGYTGYVTHYSYSYGTDMQDGITGTLTVNGDAVPSNAVNNGSSVTVGSITFSDGSTLTQNSGSLTITGSISGDGDIIINGGSLTVDGLVNVTAAKAGSISARELFTPNI